MAPTSAIFPAVICKHIASRKSSEIVHPGRSFVLVCLIRGGVIYLYRTMQADLIRPDGKQLTNIWLFVGLSLFKESNLLLKIEIVESHHLTVESKCLLSNTSRNAVWHSTIQKVKSGFRNSGHAFWVRYTSYKSRDLDLVHSRKF